MRYIILERYFIDILFEKDLYQIM